MCFGCTSVREKEILFEVHETKIARSRVGKSISTKRGALTFPVVLLSPRGLLSPEENVSHISQIFYNMYRRPCYRICKLFEGTTVFCLEG